MSNCSLYVLSADTACVSCATLVSVSSKLVISSKDPGKLFAPRTSINSVSAWVLLLWAALKKNETRTMLEQRACLLIHTGPLLCRFGSINCVWLIDREQAGGHCGFVQYTVQKRLAIGHLREFSGDLHCRKMIVLMRLAGLQCLREV